jgi:putative FmdB family regulatory protein
MPIYEYICQECKYEFELIRPMAQADAPQTCEKCAAANIKRKISVFYAESGGNAVSGMSAPTCGSCSGGDCGSCGH